MNVEIANRLVQLRKQNNFSQESLAEKLGISRQAVSKWERAEASPDTDNLILLARLYGVSLDELLRTEEERFPSDEECFPTESGREHSHLDIHIDWRGIRISETGNQGVKVEWNGFHRQSNQKESRIWFPFGLFVCVAYLILGIVYHAWHPGWLILLTIPIYYAVVTWILYKRKMCKREDKEK